MRDSRSITALVLAVAGRELLAKRLAALAVSAVATPSAALLRRALARQNAIVTVRRVDAIRSMRERMVDRLEQSEEIARCAIARAAARPAAPERFHR